jgi:hypothetical protein
MTRENAQVRQHEAESTKAMYGGGLNRSSDEIYGNIEGAKGLGQLVKQILTTCHFWQGGLK